MHQSQQRTGRKINKAEKRTEPHASIMTYTRTKTRFALLRSTLIAIRRFRE